MLRFFGWGNEKKPTDEKQSTNPQTSRGSENTDHEESKSFEACHEATISNDDYFIVKNPIVLLICCSEYKGGWVDLPGVKRDYEILYNLFHDFYGWRVQSIHENVTQHSILKFWDDQYADIVKLKAEC